MEEQLLRQQIVDTGLELLKTGLVARTWGNVSAKVDETHLLITPSGLDYMRTKPENLALYDSVNKTYEGTHKPSSEKGIHASAYELLKDANFVIHTHQTFATAYGLCGFESLEMTPEEREKLGGIAVAEYGLPGTKTLKNAVRNAFAGGAHTVLMKHHGAVVAGSDKEDAFEKVRLLEEICRRNYKGHDLSEKASVAYSKLEIPLPAQLDDMAQMIGSKVPVVSGNKEEALQKYNAILVPGEGAFVKGKDADDTEALEILVEKAAVTALHLRQNKVKGKLGWLDIALMNFVYQQKYSKQKGK